MTILVQEYINDQVEPYADAMRGVTNVDDLRNWIPLIITDQNMVAAFNSIIHTDVQSSILEIIELLTNILVEGALEEREHYSPWDISRNKTPLAERLFGNRSNTIPVTVYTPSNVFTHELTEEQVLGIITGLYGQPTNNPVRIFIGRHEMIMDDVVYWQQHRIRPPLRYKVIIGNNTILFQTPEFIQGVITGLEWRGANMQMIGATIYEIKETGDQLLSIS